ncbi:MAG: TRAP transporter fused permease subunit [Burkholderiaceae bacterium]
MINAVNFLSQLFAVALTVLAIRVAGFGVFDNVIVSGLAVWLGVMAALLIKPADVLSSRWKIGVVVGFALAFAWVMWDWVSLMLAQEQFLVTMSFAQHSAAWTGIVLLGLLTWRRFGPPIAIVGLLCAIYVLAPEGLGGAGQHWTRVAENLWFTSDGVFGRPVEVVSRTVLIFIVFGSVLQVSGAGDVLLKIAFAATGRLPGGPAHSAVIGSSMFGMLNGAAVANVVSTGVVTIPIIKRVGFTPRFAGAVEAAASTGGQIMPPVMGVVAFLMADMTNIPYLTIVAAATIPALLYYGSLFAVVTIEARRQGVGAIPAHEREKLTRQDWLRSLVFWIPLAVLVALMAQGRSPQHAGFYATIIATILALILFPAFRSPVKLWEALVDAGRTSAMIMVVVAAIGFVIGVVNMTGTGLIFAEAILAASGSSLIVSLLMVMGACIVLGMGVPTGAAYLIIAVILGPALQKLGLPMLAAHFFIVYFAVLSAVTPPVALAAFAAAPIAGAGPMETGFEAVRLSLAGFIIPFVFCYHPDILLVVEGFSVGGLIWTLIAYAIATWCFASGIAGHDRDRLSLPERVLRLIAGAVALAPDLVFALPATLIAAAVIARHAWRAPRKMAEAVQPPASKI